MEARHFGEHAQVAAAQDVPAAEQSGRTPGARVLQAAAVAPYGHAHLGVLGGDAELVEEPEQVRVGALVVHDESAVHEDRAAVAGGQFVGVGVAAQAVVRLVEHHVVRALQHVGGGQSRHSRTHHGHSPTVHFTGPLALAGPARSVREASHEYFGAGRPADGNLVLWSQIGAPVHPKARAGPKGRLPGAVHGADVRGAGGGQR